MKWVTRIVALLGVLAFLSALGGAVYAGKHFATIAVERDRVASEAAQAESDRILQEQERLKTEKKAAEREKLEEKVPAITRHPGTVNIGANVEIGVTRYPEASCTLSFEVNGQSLLFETKTADKWGDITYTVPITPLTPAGDYEALIACGQHTVRTPMKVVAAPV